MNINTQKIKEFELNRLWNGPVYPPEKASFILGLILGVSMSVLLTLIV